MWTRNTQFPLLSQLIKCLTSIGPAAGGENCGQEEEKSFEDQYSPTCPISSALMANQTLLPPTAGVVLSECTRWGLLDCENLDGEPSPLSGGGYLPCVYLQILELANEFFFHTLLFLAIAFYCWILLWTTRAELPKCLELPVWEMGDYESEDTWEESSYFIMLMVIQFSNRDSFMLCFEDIKASLGAKKKKEKTMWNINFPPISAWIMVQ